MKHGLVVAACALAGCQTTDETFEFALLGDNPYSAEAYVAYERLIEDVNSHPDLTWVVHLGDLKGGGQSCSNEFLTARFELNQRFDAPFVYTPGDNDWLDCSREAAGAYDEYGRLAFLRSVFFPEPGRTTGGDPMPVESQAASEAEFTEFVENVMWERGGVVFATVHVLGPTRPPTDPAAMAERNRAAEAWIERAFERAEASDARAVFLAMQADPWVAWGLPEILAQYCPGCLLPRPGLEWLYGVLRDATLAFARPVVLAVGDTHIFRVDKPLYTEDGRLITNFTRVETFGSPDVHWVRVSVDDSPWVFSFHQEIVE